MTFSEKFREGAVRLVLDGGKAVGAVARELDLTPSALGLWVQHAHDASGQHLSIDRTALVS